MRLLNIRLIILILSIFPLEKICSQNPITPSVKIKDHKENTGIINIDCDYDFLPNKGIKLIATYPDIRQTNNYSVSSIDYTPIGDFSKGQVVDIRNNGGKQDDTYSNVISLPFNFCFYGNSYSQVIISDNGVVSFNTALAQQECPYAPPALLPTGLPKNSIFGVFHDMQNINQVRYQVDGVAPNRRVIINYNSIPQYGYAMPGKNSTSQIVLYETTNIIDIYVKDRFKNESTNPIFDGTGAYRKNAVIGLTNYDSSAGIAAPGRNTGNWEAHNEAWRFSPDGSTNITIQWFNEFDSEISGTRNAASILVYPTQNTKYKVKVTYNMCVPVSVTDVIEVKFSQDFPTANQTTTEAFCINNGESYTLDLTSYEPQINPDSSLSFSYFEDQNLTIPISYPKDAYIFSNNKVVYVKVLKSGVCYSVGKLNLKLNKRPIVTPDQSFEKCDQDNDGKETINLNALGITGLSGSNYKYFESAAAASLGTPAITNYTSYLVDVTATTDQTKTLYLRVWNASYNDPNCYTIVPFKIKLKKYIKVKSPNQPFLICHVTEGQLLRNYDLTQYEPQLLDTPATGVSFEYYTTSNYTSYYKIVNPSLATFTMNTTIYIKATAAGYCDAYTQISLAADDDCDGTPGGGGGGGGATGPGGPGGGGGPICDTNDSSITVNLDVDYLQFYLQGGLTLPDITILGFYDSANNSLLTNTTPYIYTFSPPFFKVIQAHYKINATGVESYVNFPVSASTKATINPDTFDICDTYNDDEETITLKLNYNPKPKWQTVLETAYPDATIHFFASADDLNNYETNPDNPINSSKIITSTTLTNPLTTLYVYVKYYGCIYKHEIKFNLVPVVVKPTNPYIICDFDDDKKELVDLIKITDNETDVKNEITAAQLIGLQAPITYYQTLTQAHAGATDYITNLTSFEITDSNMSVFARLNIKDECPVIVEIKFQFTTSVALPVLKNLVICDTNNDNQEEVNLNNAIVSTNPGAEITFYGTSAAAEAGNETSPYFISATLATNYLATTSPATIYVRVYDSVTTCWKILSFTITLVQTPVLINTTIKTCDSGDDGKEILTSSYIQTQLISYNASSISSAMTYKFYETQADAILNTNPSLATFEATATNSVWVNIAQTLGDCPIIEELKFTLVKPPLLETTALVYTICNNNTGNENGAIKENIILDSYKNDILGIPASPSYSFTYYDTSENDAIDGGSFGKVASAYTITSFPKIIWARVTNTSTGCFSIKSIEFQQTPSLESAIADSEIIACANGEMSKEVNLEDYPPQMITAPASLNNFNISYHNSRANAVNNTILTSDITHYTVTPASQIWLKFVSKATGCYIIKKLSVTIYSTPKAQDIFPEVCDETDGKLDGSYIIPDLSVYKNQIITGESNLENLYTFTYYKNLADANAKDTNTISNLNYTFTKTDLQPGIDPAPDLHTLYARIDKQDNTGCFSVAAISFQINKKVPVNTVQPEILNCDEPDNDGKTSFDLSSVKDQISTTSGVSFKYYPTNEDAQSNTNEITNFTTWQNLTPYEHIVYVRVNASGYCDNIASIKLKVYPYIQANDYADAGRCEFEADGVTKSTVNLLDEAANMTAQINSITQFPNLLDDVDIHFYADLNDAQNPTLTNSIPTADLTAHLFPVGVTDIWVRFQSKTTKCFEIKKLSITIFNTPNAQDISPNICDETDGKLDGNYIIPDLHAYKNQIITAEPNLDNLFTFTYYKNQADAVAKNTNNISNLNYTFTETDLQPGIAPAPDSHTIYARIDKQDNTGCFSVAAISFQINKKVPVNTVQPEILNCDEADNDGKTSFDLSSVKDQISTTSGVSFKYYPTNEDAQSNTNEITNFATWQNLTPYEHIVHVRVNASGYCDNIASIKLKVYPYIQANDYADNTICKFKSDGITENMVNLLNEVKHMTAQINSIPQYPNLLEDVDIHFYADLNDAQNPTLTNSIPTADLTAYVIPVGVTDIWVRFQSKTTKCFEIKKLSLTKLESPQFTVEVTPFRCSPENDFLDAIVKIVPLNNSETYTYSFDNGLTFSNTDNININSEKTVNYIVADANGCTIAGNVFVPGYNPPTDMDIEAATIYCNTLSNAPIITVKSVTGAVAGNSYTYEIISPVGIAPANATGIFLGLLPETYQIKATDDVTKCYIIKSVDVKKATEISVAVQSHTDVLCYGENTGAITYSVSNFITSPNYTFELIPNLLGLIPTQTGDVITYEGLASGNYTFKVTDNMSGCIAEVVDFAINQPVAPLTLTGTTTNITCNGANDGKIVISATGGTGSIKYAISPDLTHFNDQFQFDHLTPGTYQIAVQDQAGCSGNGLLTLEIKEPAVLSAQVTGPIIQEMCDGDKDGSFSIAILGGTPPYNVSLDNENGAYTAILGSQYDFTYLSGGRHKVYVRDTYCLTELEVILDKAVTLNPKAEIHYDCVNNSAVNSVTITVHESNTNSSDIDYALDNSTTYQPSNIFANISPGTHTITARHTNGCEQTTLPFMIDEVEKLALTLDNGELNEIVAKATGGYGGYQYSINGEAYTSTNKMIIYKSGIYTFSVVDKKGCTAVASKYFEYIDVCIPDHFTPNGDGINDTWAPGCTVNYRNLTYDILDRHGRVICRYKLGQQWDGKYNGAELPSGDYWYVLKLNDDKDNREFVGHFTLYR
jgi:gliding motility-associated-like protein